MKLVTLWAAVAPVILTVTALSPPLSKRSPPHPLEEHAGWWDQFLTVVRRAQPGACNADNCLRGLRNPTASSYASSLCTGLIRVTRTAQATATVTIRETVTKTPPVQVVIESATATETVPATITKTITSTPGPGLKERAAPPATSRFSSEIYSLCSSQPAKVSSACSCFVTPSPVTVTATATQTARVTDTVTLLPQKTTVTTVVATQTVTDVTTLTVTEFAPPVSTPEAFACNGPAQGTYTPSGGDGFTIYCSSFYAGFISRTVHMVQSIQACIDECQATAACESVSYFPEEKDCFLFQDLNVQRAPGQTWISARRIRAT